MAFAPGTRLGAYEILADIGAGGMGEVYKARDTRLDRLVAVKVLLPHVAGDPVFRERFEREARAASALDHPHICALYDLGQEQGIQFLVLQYLEGETLAARLIKGPLPLDQALKHVCEIADALDKAHRQGIVHRDLKPGNVMLTKTGAKLLDFGLAKAASVRVGAAASATMTRAAPVTAEGTILGTLQYMAPEQLEGKEADARSDIWALGCVLYEMLTGRRAFDSHSQATLVAAILEHEPAPLSQVTPTAPAALDHVVRRCLAKDPDERWASAHDVLLEFRWIADGGTIAGPAAASTVRRWHERLLVGLLALTTVAAVVVALVHLRETPAPPVHGVFESRLPADVTLASLQSVALSPDRRLVVFTAQRSGVSQLFLRSLNSLQISALTGTEDGSGPFWSPDSSDVAFSAHGKLKRVSVRGGVPVDVCDATGVSPGSWNAAGVIIFASHGAVYRVSAAGGAPQRITPEAEYLSPTFLPDGRRFLVRGTGDGVYAGALDQSTMLKVAADADAPKVALAAGHLLFMRRGSLLAQPFDLMALKPTGAPLPIAEDVRWNAFDGAMFAVQDDVLVFARGRTPNRLRWMARSGAPLGHAGEPGPYSHFRIAPSGTKIAVQHSGDLWLLDVTTDVMTRLTSDPAHDADPAWSPDERRIVFTSLRTGRVTIFEKDLTTGVERQLLADPPPPGAVVDDWSPDGRWVIFRNIGPLVYGLPMDGERKPRLIGDAQGPGADSAHLSPDGRWLAFTDEATGRAEVSIARFPDFTDKHQVSRGGGMQPMWRRDGKELFYLGTDAKIYAVPIQDGTSQIAGAPVPLFETRIRPDTNFDQYGVVDNGQRFLVLDPEQPSESLTFVLDWTARVRPR